LQGNLEDDFSDEAEFLTDGCKKLKALDFQYQAEFWKEMASAFGPWKYTDPRADVDAVVRYFDGTLCGVEYMMMYSKGRENLPDNESICRLLVHKYGFLGGRDHDAVMKNEKFQEFCRLILDDDPEREEVAVSACWAFRHLRVGALLGKPRDPKGWNVYYYNYDDSKVDGSVVASRRKERVFKNKAWVEEMIVEPQMSCGSLPSSRYPDCTPPVSVDEFFMKPLSHTLNVHWAHAHNPCQECILALGQHYRLRVHSQCLLTRLEDASAQMEFANNDDWSSIVFPAVYLDQESRRSLQRYRVWMQKKTVKAAMSGRTLGVALSPSAFDVSEVHLQPHIDIGVVRMNLMIFWSARDESTVVSVAAKPKYNAKWETPRRRQKGSMLPAWLFFWRRSKPEKEGYKRVPTSAWEDDDGFLLESDVEEGRAETEQEMEEEEEEEAEGLMEAKFRYLQMQAKAEACTKFEDAFGRVLTDLSRENSVLRMGSYTQLVYRILLNRSIDYLDVLSVYEAALGQLQGLLASKETNKGYLINKVSIAKLELEGLLLVVQPLVENVLSKLPAIVEATTEKDLLPSRVCRHHKFDMANNFKEFLVGSQTLISLCKNLADEYDRKSKDQVNNILNALTMIMFVILPLQILTGLYGMNFKHMPELEWAYGYHYFFVLALCVTSMTACLVLGVYKASIP